MSPKHTLIIAGALLIIIAVLAVLLLAQKEDVISEEICDLQDNDKDGSVDEGFSITCNDDNDCGFTGTYGDPYCREGHVWQGMYISECTNEPGSCLSECVNTQTAEVIEYCDDDCLFGRCV